MTPDTIVAQLVQRITRSLDAHLDAQKDALDAHLGAQKEALDAHLDAQKEALDAHLDAREEALENRVEQNFSKSNQPVMFSKLSVLEAMITIFKC